MKITLTLIISLFIHLTLQAQVTGKVISTESDEPIPGVTISSDQGILLAVTDHNGHFEISQNGTRYWFFSHVSFYKDTIRAISSKEEIEIRLRPLENKLNEVIISTGYQNIKTGVLTGSYTQIDNELLNRSTGTNILQRLEGVSNGLLFIRSGQIGERGGSPDLQIRGKNTLYGNANTLIILDNFPYEGSIQNINPNDIESVTILKDAAAASIWGARAGNGVIVITSKKGANNQDLKIDLSSNFIITSRPNLFYSPEYLSAPDIIEVEKELYNRNFYPNSQWELQSPVVYALFQGNISEVERLKEVDFRERASRLLYRNAVQQQHAINFRGGGNLFSYFVSGGWDASKESVIGNKSSRQTFQSNFTFNPIPKLELNVFMNTTFRNSESNGVNVSSLIATGKQAVLPYTELQNTEGNAIPIYLLYGQNYIDQAEGNGLLNWQYRPLQDRGMNDINSKSVDNRINTSIKYSILPSLKLEARFQYQSTVNSSENMYSEDSYYTRNLINRFTQSNGSRPIPLGGIRMSNGSQYQDYSGRLQATFEQKMPSLQSNINAIAGFEARQGNNKSMPSSIIYGLNEEVMIGSRMIDYSVNFPTRPSGSSYVPAPASSVALTTIRFLSYFANLNYGFKERYGLTFSARKDGSNIYGVKTNQKFVPLWSVGASWLISKEDFFKSNSIDFFKLRTSFGYSGNSLNSATAYATANYSIDSRTGLQRAALATPGNISLQWEKIKTINVGVDYSLLSRRISGSIEYYQKFGLDLLGENVMDPTTGIGFIPIQGPLLRNMTNYANTKTNGVDLEVNTKNTRGIIKWNTSFLLNWAKSIVTQYNGTPNPNIFAYTNTGTLPVIEGNPVNSFYSLPWYGLRETDGSPLVPTADGLGTNYANYINNLTPNDLLLEGSSIPQLFGSFRNEVIYKNFSISANLTFKANYYFRAKSIDYNQLFNRWQGHQDFNQRWQQPGDELNTNVPSLPSSENYDPSGRRDLVYTTSTLHSEKGSHIRWNDIQASYTLKKLKNTFRFSMYVRDLGIIWSSTKKGIDPDYPSALYPPGTSYSFGFNMSI